ncbi:DUF1440 domain-containing protein [Dyadobacter sp. NIV53]|uniref:DUF1440 domain-containing protein n=1 Tax=Dyadobacter sp. NIV53 TaxID=2861765 RepID=UPI001C8734EF|nr:DUF1440 domain-containing protein [Dyadobacter sp. NIV53]
MKGRSLLLTITLAAFLSGLLDLVVAIIVYSILLDKTTALRILQSVASGVFGKTAYSGGIEMAVIGLVFHFIISFIFTYLYFFAYTRLAFLRKERVFSGFVFGFFIWLVMNLIVLPITFSGLFPSDFVSALIGIAIIIISIGIPVSLIAHFYYNRTSLN